jgi:hypothetical protein
MLAMKTNILILLTLVVLTTSCATITGGHITHCQKTKPAKGEPKRKLKTGKFVWDIVLGVCTYGIGIPIFLGIDFGTGAIWQPCEESLTTDPKTGKQKPKGFQN